MKITNSINVNIPNIFQTLFFDNLGKALAFFIISSTICRYKLQDSTNKLILSHLDSEKTKTLKSKKIIKNLQKNTKPKMLK